MGEETKPATVTEPVVEQAPADPIVQDAPVTEPVVEQAPEITHESFGWDSWDGSADALPETVRGWATKLSDHYMKAAASAQDEASYVRKTYEALIEGRPDPRLEKLKGELDTKLKELEQFQGTAKEWERKALEAERKATEVQAAWERAEEERASAVAKDFSEKHPWMFDDGPISELAVKLLDEKFPLETLPELLRMPDKQLERVRQIHTDLAGAKNAAQHAIALARQPAAITQPASANLVEAETRVGGGHQPATRVDGDSLTENLSRAVDFALHRANRS